MEPMLNTLRIPYVRAHTLEELRSMIVKATNTMNASCYPVCVIVGTELGGEVSPI